MSGPTETALYPFAPIVATCLVAAFTDLVRGKIYNWLTLPSLVTGLAFAFYQGGWIVLGHAALAVVAGFALYGWMYWLGMMGGGDVKLLMALGAWGGTIYVVKVALLGVLLGGVMAFLLLLIKGRLLDLLRRLYRFVISLIVDALEVESPRIDRKLTMPFGLAISGAAIWVLYADPLVRWGIFPW